MNRFILASVLVGACIAAVSAPAQSGPRADASGSMTLPSDSSQERERITRERTEADAKFAARQRECRKRFVVTSCLEEASRERRETESRLKRERNEIDDAQRKTRAAERSAEIVRRQKEKATDLPNQSDREPKSHTRSRSIPEQQTVRPTDLSVRAPKQRDPSSVRLRPAPGSQLRSSDEAERSRAAFEERQRKANERREEVETRNAERLKRKPAAAPLPIPPATSPNGSR
ncbi:MAG: hypothetical protein ABIV63_11125 [Caldimonas sp.]